MSIPPDGGDPKGFRRRKGDYTNFVSVVGRILALDWGKSRIGLAISDELGITVRTLPTLERRNRASDLEALSSILSSNQVTRLVVGLPLHLSGAASKSASQAEQLGRTMANRTGVELVLWDERLSSAAAEDLLAKRGSGRPERGKVDAVAAALTLRSYLDAGAPYPVPAAARSETDACVE